MKLTGLDGKSHSVNIAQNNYPLRSRAACKSELQFQCGQLLRTKYPSQVILEEFPVPGSRLKLDFFLPTLRVAVEVHGAQHDSFNKHFHGNLKGFHQSRHRDGDKASWCEINDITLYEVRSVEEMQDLLGIKDGK